MKYSELIRSEVPEFKSRIVEAKGEVTLDSLRAFVNMFEIRSHDWIPEDNPFYSYASNPQLFYRQKFFRLLNLGSVSE